MISRGGRNLIPGSLSNRIISGYMNDVNIQSGEYIKVTGRIQKHVIHFRSEDPIEPFTSAS